MRVCVPPQRKIGIINIIGVDRADLQKWEITELCCVDNSICVCMCVSVCPHMPDIIICTACNRRQYYLFTVTEACRLPPIRYFRERTKQKQNNRLWGDDACAGAIDEEDGMRQSCMQIKGSQNLLNLLTHKLQKKKKHPIFISECVQKGSDERVMCDAMRLIGHSTHDRNMKLKTICHVGHKRTKSSKSNSS